MIKKYKIFFLFIILSGGISMAISQTSPAEKTPSWVPTENSFNYVNYIENKGQWCNKVLYQADFFGGRIFLEKNALTYVFYPPGGAERMHPHPNANPKDFVSCTLTFQAVRMQFLNSSVAGIEGGDKKSFYNNYFVGKDHSHWQTGARAFGNVMYHDLYPGISVKVFSNLSNVRYDFMLAPHADPSLIKLQFTGQNSLSLNNNQLIIHTEIGNITEAAPYAYQDINGKRVKVDCQYTLEDDNVIGLVMKNYDASQPLTIDPTLVFATFTGSTADNWGMSATNDPVSSDCYTSGICFGVGYPTTPGAFQATFNGGGTGGGNNYGGFDIVISKFNPSGSTMLFSTYLGGTDNEEPQSIIVDNADNLLVLGRTYSTDFPVTSGVFQKNNGGGADIIISKFDSTGKMLASTYVGGSGDDGVNISAVETTLSSLKYNYADDGRGDIIVDNNNNVYVASCTSSSNFPTTPGAYQTAEQGMQDGCVFEMSSTLSSLVWSTYLGGSSDDAAYNIALNKTGDAYVVGGTASSNFPTTPGVIKPSYGGNIDGFITHFSSSGKMLQSSYLGTSSYDQAYFVQTDRYNNVYVYGQCGTGYPVTAGAYSVPNSGQFIHEMNPILSSTVFSTVFGTGKGTPDIAPSAFLVDNCFNIYISGWGGQLYGYNRSTSTTKGLPVTAGAFQSTTDGSDFYFMVLQHNAGALWYATYFGGPISCEHVDGGTSRFDKNGIIYQAICEGCGGSSDMPTTPGVWSTTNNSPNCNNALVKFKMDLTHTFASFNVPSGTGCAPYSVAFQNTSTNGLQYKWYFGDGDSSLAPAPNHVYSTPGIYKVMLVAIDSFTCNMLDTGYATIKVMPPITLTAPSTFVCAGDSVQLNAVCPGALSYSWSPGNWLNNNSVPNPKSAPPSTTSYYVTAKDSFCAVTDTVNVQVYSNQTKVSPDSIKICTGDSVKLTTDSSYVTYQWSTGSTASSIQVSQAGSYSVITTDKHGCKGKDSVMAVSYPKVPLFEKDTALCKTSGIQLYADSGNYTYFWMPSSTLNKNNIFNPIAKPTKTTTYTVSVTNGPCISIDSVKVIFKPLPWVKTEPDSTIVLPGQTVVLNVSGTGPFTWYPSAGLSCDSCPAPIVTIDSNTIYYVQVTDTDGCTAYDSVIVDVQPTIYVPNAFTPNGDGENDVFRPKFTGYKSMEVYIFNRWGELLYHWNTLNGGWDGTYKGNPVQEDTYVYMIKAVSYLNKTYNKIGRVTVIR